MLLDQADGTGARELERSPDNGTGLHVLNAVDGAEKSLEQLLDGPKEKWKPDLAVVKATIRVLEKTGRLTYQQEVIQPV